MSFSIRYNGPAIRRDTQIDTNVPIEISSTPTQSHSRLNLTRAAESAIQKKTATQTSQRLMLIEVLIRVLSIGILAAIAIPKVSNRIDKSNEGTTRGNLGSLRSALSIYYADTEGQYPQDGMGSTKHNKHKPCLTCNAN